MLLEIKDLHIGFETQGGPVYAVNGISFSVREGEAVGIIGESGCGKSVTCNAVLKLDPTARLSGQILFDGKDLMALDEKGMNGIRGNEISLIPQNTASALNPLVTIGKQITEIIHLHQGLGKSEARDAAIKLLSELNVPDVASKLNEYPFQQSLGIIQRILIAIALSCNPKLIIADEPTSSLDATIQNQIIGIFKSIKRKTALLIVSHDLSVIRETTDKTIVMYRGQVMEEGTTESVFERPLHPYTQALIAASPYGKEQITLKGEQPSSMLKPVGCPFASRCPRVVGDICHEVQPQRSELQNDVYCHIYSVK